MDGLTFASKVLEAVAWPITVLVLAFKFSDRVRDLLDKLTEVSLPGGISGKFEKPLKSAEKLAERLDQTEAVAVGVEAPKDDPVALIANPTGVIMEAWKGLEAIGADLYQASDASSRDKMLMYTSGNQHVLSALEEDKLIPDDEIQLLRELSSIRNRAAHSTTGRPTSEAAERFVSLVRLLTGVWIGRLAAGKPR